MGSQVMNTQKEIILLRLAELMLFQEKNFLDIDDLYEDEFIGSEIKNIQIDSFFQQLVYSGSINISNQDNNYIVRFSQEQYFHYVLGSYLYSKTTTESSLFFLVDSLLDNKLNGLKEGLTQCLIFFVDSKRNSILTKFIDHYPLFAVSSTQALAKDIQINGEELLIEILKEKTESDILVLIKVVEHFEYSNKPQFNKLIAQITLDIISPTSLLEFSLHAELSRYFDKMQLSQLYEQTLDFLRLFEFNKNQDIYLAIKIVNNLGREILRYSEKQKALTIYEFGYNLTLDLTEFAKENMMIYGHIAHQLKSIGKTKEATDKYIDIIERLKSNNHFVLAAQNMLRLSEVYKQANRLEEALQLAQNAHSIMLKFNGNLHLLSASSSGYIGSIYIYLKDWKRAEQFIKHSMINRIKLLGEFNTKVCIQYVNLAVIYMNLGQLEKSEELLTKALNIREKRFGRLHQDIAITLYELANLNIFQDKLNESLILHEEAYHIRKYKLGNNHYFTNKSRLALAKLYKLLNRKNDFKKISNELIENCKGDNIENKDLLKKLYII